MDNPTGRIVSLVDRAGGAHAIVRVTAVAACPRCAQGKGCGAGLFAAGKHDRELEVSVPAGLVAAVNDEVEIGLAADNLLRAAFLVYGLPLLGAVVAAGVAYAATLGDAAAAAAALLGLSVGLAIGRWRLRQTDCLQHFVATVLRLL